MRTSPLTLVALGLALLAGCYAGNASPYVDGGPGNDGAIPGGDGTPCAVSALLTKYCLRCHNGRAISASDLPLTGYDALTAKRGGMTVGELALQRLHSTSKPMPPRGQPTPSSAEVQILSDWVMGGYAPEQCGMMLDAGSVPDPYDTPTVCTSGTHWRGGDEGSSRMNPGEACIDCHSRTREDAPTFQFAGTVYPSAHEPDSCNGANDGTHVVIVDSQGTELTLTPNSAGNFSARRTSLVLPYTVRLERGSDVREMSTAQTSGDCNSCHTESGKNRAPGRVMAP
jgi:hypothetical protein